MIFSEEEFHISASDKEWQVRGDDEIDSYSEYELDGYVIEEISLGEDGGLSEYGYEEVHEDKYDYDVDIKPILAI